MKQSLSLKLGQSLVMTPQLQQAIKLLQLSTLDLQLEIQEAIDGSEAVSIFETWHPDLILMDIMMPVTDGIEATRYLKSDDSLKHIPVIGLSASADSESVRQCYEAGADDHIAKPIQFDELISTMTRLLQ